MFPYVIVFGKMIGTYGMFAAFGGIAAGIVMYFLIRKKGGTFPDMMLFGGFVAMGILLGGSILYGITNISMLGSLFSASSIGEFGTILMTMFGGSVFYGGLIGGAATGCLAVKLFKLDKSLYFDSFAVIAPLFHAFARVGCFLGGCCYGIECEFGFTAHRNPFVPAVNGVCRFPVQLLEAFCNLLIFAALLYMYRKGISKKKLFFVYVCIYAVVRFALEFLRGDEIRGFVGVLSTSQFISVILLILLIIGSIINKNTENKLKKLN